MSQLSTALKRLSEGEFICRLRYPEEYEALSSSEGHARAEQWLGEIGYRLARLSEDGAYFMAHAVPTTELRAQLRDEMRSVRGKLEPIVGFMETLRQSQGRAARIQPGDVFFESEINEAVRNSPLLENRIREMRDISNARLTDDTNDLVRKMLTQMVDSGYLVLTNQSNRGFQFTGKVEYLYQLLEFIRANSSYLTDEDVVDQMDSPQAQQRLDTDTQTPEAP